MKSIKVGGITYKIEKRELEGVMGKTDFTKSIIYLDEKLNKEQEQATLIHEILHCVNNQLSEKDVEYLAQSLYQIIKDNKLWRR